MNKRNVSSARKIVRPITKPKPPMRSKKAKLPSVELGLTVDLTHSFSRNYPTRATDIEIKGSLSFQDTDPKEYTRLFVHKIKECSKLCDFSRPNVDQKAKATKAELLRHIISGLSLPSVQKILTADLMKQFYDMVSINIFRKLPSSPISTLYEANEVVLDTAWSHLSLIYSALQASFSCNFTNQMNSKFIYNLIRNATSADGRERTAVLDTLKWLYQKCIQTRIPVRAALGSLFSDLIANTELISFYRIIIQAFNIPLKPEHINFYRTKLLPLHRININKDPVFWDTFRLCISDFLTKSPPLLVNTASYILSHWPLSEPAKEISFIDELTILFITFAPSINNPNVTNSNNSKVLNVDSNDSKKFNNNSNNLKVMNVRGNLMATSKNSLKRESMLNMPIVVEKFYKQIGKCIESPNSDVSQAAMDILLNTNLHEAVVQDNYSIIYLNVLDGLMKTHKTHWDATVRDNAYETMNLIREFDPEVFQNDFLEISKRNKEIQNQGNNMIGWTNISELALENYPKKNHQHLFP